MDTRRKIVVPAKLLEALRSDQWIVVLGFFDPLTACQARRIAEHAAIARKILVVVLPSHSALLGEDARAQLVAALREVDLVAISSSEDVHKLLAGVSNLIFDEDPAAEQKRSGEFRQFILGREGQGSAAGRGHP